MRVDYAFESALTLSCLFVLLGHGARSRTSVLLFAACAVWWGLTAIIRAWRQR